MKRESTPRSPIRDGQSSPAKNGLRLAKPKAPIDKVIQKALDNPSKIRGYTYKQLSRKKGVPWPRRPRHPSDMIIEGAGT